MRVGVVGCGYWGSKHVRVLHGLTQVSQVAIIEPDDSRRCALLKAFSGSKAFPTLEAALDAVDSVIIATPPSTHADLAARALEAGKGVLVEKPLSTRVDDAHHLIDIADDSSLVLMVGHTFEYNAAVWKLRELVNANELGTIQYIDTARLNLGLYQDDINVIWDLAAHDVSITNYILGAAPDVVQAWGSCHAQTQLEDVAYLRLQYRSVNVTAQIHVSWLDPCKVRRVTVVGSRKMAVYNDLAQDERVRVYDKGVVPLPRGEGLHAVPMSYRYGDITSPFVAFQEPLGVQDAHFLECISQKKQPLTDGKNGLAVVRTLEATELSLREGRPVELNLEDFLIGASA